MSALIADLPMTVSLVCAGVLLAFGLLQLRAEQVELREREAVTDGWAAALGRRESELRRREAALHWTERQLA